MNKRIKGGLLVFFGAASFGLLSTIVKFAYAEGYTLGEITGTQSFSGMAILWLLYFITKSIKKEDKKEKAEETQPKTKWWKIALAGTFTGLVGIFYYQCVKLLPASVAIILLMQYLWISMLIEAIVFRKKPSRKQLLLLGVVLLGTLLAGGLFSQEIMLNIKGVIFGLLAATCYAIFLMTSGRIGNDLPVLKKSALMITGSCTITWIIFPPLFFFNGVYFSGLVLWGLALALLGTVIPPLLFSMGIPRVGVSIGAILSAVELPVAILSSAFILHESVDALRWLGVILILLAIVATNIKTKEISG
ncbi:drug/metabolite transporter (DMT)-like permease [Dysgonomonas hofstadii]|uniref:Drug/metabolite transporter (DMT)-like permease n=1 Tax=Dysgonomonas hofstadii TaxID=637886 RepID=A0A840CVW8_9BACT|nr:DMT family transporter [Dysgonomonas hofstadii]MBB4036955.1 drug/metabolite transporter (DMT)-like permease [Dysgonomonas hofstadii]